MADYRDVLLISETTLKDNSLIDDNVSFDYLKPIAKAVQDTRLTRLLGHNMYRAIRAEVAAGSISDETKELLDHYITYILIWGITEQIQVNINVKIRNQGSVTLSNENANSIGVEDLKYTKGQAANNANWYEIEMERYICDNRSKYPLYYPSKTNGTNCNIYLGK